MATYNINGIQVHAETAGQPNRQVVILIHGWSSSWYAMSPLMPLLAQRFYVVAVDLPGFGQSPKLATRTTIDGYVEIIAKLIEEVSNGPVVLVGHSMGGMISMALALKYPVLVERLVLLCPTITGILSTYINLVLSPITIAERFAVGSFIISAGEKLMVGLTDRLMRPASFAERTGISSQDYLRLRADVRRPDQGRVRAECYTAMRNSNLADKVSKIEAPSLIIWGAEDNTVPLRDSGIVADEWLTADLRILPKAGHWPQFETPDATRRLIAAFLGLPFSTTELRTVEDHELAAVNEIAQFLSHSDVGNNLNENQRLRLAGQFRRKTFKPSETIVRMQDGGSEMYIVESGNVEVWSDPENFGQTPKNLRHIATLTPGQITGELAMLDGGLRSADLRAGPEGAQMLTLERERLLALCEDDTALGTRVLWNVSRAMALRARFILWQLQRALQRAASQGITQTTLSTSTLETPVLSTPPVIAPTLIAASQKTSAGRLTI